MPRMVWVELGKAGRAVRILKNQKQAVILGIARWALLLRATAVEDIRRAIWERDGKKCQHCGNTVTWGTMNMHERIWRGKGGEVSVDNGVTLCYTCHSDDPVAGHGKRKPQWK